LSDGNSRLAAGARPSGARAGDTHADYTCGDCGYGIAAYPPAMCPICRSTVWIAAGLHHGAEIAVKRLSEATFLVTPPATIDVVTSIVLCDAIAALVPLRPHLVLDLRLLHTIEETAVESILRLSALIRGSDGRLLVVCEPDDTVTFHELVSSDDVGAIPGELGRVARRIRERGRL
jgi:anti-anti-sigma regulatory factor